MTQLTMARHALAELTTCIKGKDLDKTPDEARAYTPLVDVIDDTGRAIAAPEWDAVRDLLAHMAATREALEGHYLDAVYLTPLKALADEKYGASYAAGALWGVSTLLDTWLRELAHREERQRAKSARAATREAVLRLLADRDCISPGEVVAWLNHTEGREVDPTTVSKALGDLLREDVIEVAEPPPGASRRHRFYRARGTR